MSPRRSDTEDMTKFSVDFTGVGGKREVSDHVKEGDYLFVVTKAILRITTGDEELPSAKQRRYAQWTLRILHGPGRGTIINRTQVQLPGQPPSKYLWNLRGFLMDLLHGEKAIPESKVGIDLTKYIGKRIAGVVTDDDPYTPTENNPQNKTYKKSKVSATYPAADYIAQFGEPNASNDAPAANADEADDDDDEDAPTKNAVNAIDDDGDEDIDDLPVEDL